MATRDIMAPPETAPAAQPRKNVKSVLENAASDFLGHLGIDIGNKAGSPDPYHARTNYHNPDSPIMDFLFSSPEHRAEKHKMVLGNQALESQIDATKANTERNRATLPGDVAWQDVRNRTAEEELRRQRWQNDQEIKLAEDFGLFSEAYDLGLQEHGLDKPLYGDDFMRIKDVAKQKLLAEGANPMVADELIRQIYGDMIDQRQIHGQGQMNRLQTEIDAFGTIPDLAEVDPSLIEKYTKMGEQVKALEQQKSAWEDANRSLQLEADKQRENYNRYQRNIVPTFDADGNPVWAVNVFDSATKESHVAGTYPRDEDSELVHAGVGDTPRQRAIRKGETPANVAKLDPEQAQQAMTGEEPELDFVQQVMQDNPELFGNQNNLAQAQDETAAALDQEAKTGALVPDEQKFETVIADYNEQFMDDFGEEIKNFSSIDSMVAHSGFTSENLEVFIAGLLQATNSNNLKEFYHNAIFATPGDAKTKLYELAAKTLTGGRSAANTQAFIDPMLAMITGLRRKYIQGAKEIKKNYIKRWDITNPKELQIIDDLAFSKVKGYLTTQYPMPDDQLSYAMDAFNKGLGPDNMANPTLLNTDNTTAGMIRTTLNWAEMSERDPATFLEAGKSHNPDFYDANQDNIFTNLQKATMTYKVNEVRAARPGIEIDMNYILSTAHVGRKKDGTPLMRSFDIPFVQGDRVGGRARFYYTPLTEPPQVKEGEEVPTHYYAVWSYEDAETQTPTVIDNQSFAILANLYQSDGFDDKGDEYWQMVNALRMAFGG